MTAWNSRVLLAFVVVVVKDDIRCQVLVAAQDTGAICLLPASSSVFVFICKSFGYSSVHQDNKTTFNCSTEEIRINLWTVWKQKSLAIC